VSRLPRDLVHLAVDAYNSSLGRGPANANGLGDDAGPLEFVVNSFMRAGDHVITSGALVGLGREHPPTASSVILLWTFDPAGHVDEIRSFESLIAASDAADDGGPAESGGA
jgi:hypothetical protein